MAEWYSVRCDEHITSDTRFWGGKFTLEEAEMFAREMNEDGPDKRTDCHYVVRSESERPAITKDEARHLLMFNPRSDLREADALPAFPEL
jgi:hypothetical protein